MTCRFRVRQLARPVLLVMVAVLATVVLGACGSDSATSDSATSARRYVALTPVRPVSPAELAEIVRVVQARLVDMGVAEPEVRAAPGGEAVLAAVPADQERTLDSASVVGRLEFREVYTAALQLVPSPYATTAGTDGTDIPDAAVVAAFDALTCTPTPGRAGVAAATGPSDWVVACERDGTVKYLLKPAAVDGTDVATAAAGTDDGMWLVTVEFTGAGQAKFTALTEHALGRQVAIVLDGVVLSAPTVESRIPGSAVISGSFTRDEAEELAAVVKFDALPVELMPSDVTSTVPPGFS